jgi:hypothetical protein
MGILRVNDRGLLSHLADAGEARAAFESGAQLGELIRRADGVHFDAGIWQIPHVAGEMQALRKALCKVAEAHTLHNSRDQESSRLFRVSHKLRNCSREPLLAAGAFGSGDCWITPASGRDLRFAVSFSGLLD